MHEQKPRTQSTAAATNPAANARPASTTARLEDVPAAADASFGLFHYDRPRFERGWHYHPEAELTLILESSGTRHVGDHIGPFAAGDLVLLGANLPHVWRNGLGPLATGRRARSIYIHFRAEWFREESAPPEFHEIRKLLERSARGLRFPDPVRDTAARRIGELSSLQGLRRLTSFLELLQELAEAKNAEPLSSVGFAPVLDEGAGERIRRIHQHVLDNYRTGIEHRQLARSVGLSPAALSKFFRRTTGRTVTEFVNEVRVGEAARRLIDTSDNISEIAFASGFESLAHFNATFRRLKQLTPSRFRDEHRAT